MRTPIIAGNWKMNNNIEEALALVKAIHYGLQNPPQAEVIVAPTFLALNQVAEFLKDSFIGVAGQNLHWENSGAFTGEVSASMLKDAGAEYVIIGHSERRQYFGETDETVNKKIKAALNQMLKPIVCVGETLEEREAGEVEIVVRTQIDGAFAGLVAAELADIIVAYEPVWAIGTGKTASPEQAEEVHALIRKIVGEMFGQDAADKLRIQYGGSVKGANAQELLSQPNIDGALVGGASLKAEEFIAIINAAK